MSTGSPLRFPIEWSSDILACAKKKKKLFSLINTLETFTVNEILNLFLTYGYETWEWKEGIRGYSYPLMFAVMYKVLDLMNYDTAYLLVRLQCIILTASGMLLSLTCLPVFAGVFATCFPGTAGCIC